MATWSDIDQMIAEMVRDDYHPGGIVMSPRQMTRMMAGASPEARSGLYHSGDSPSGWEYQGLPIARSYEVSGPCVVSRDVWKAMRKFSRNNHFDLCASVSDTVSPLEPNPVLF